MKYRAWGLDKDASYAIPTYHVASWSPASGDGEPGEGEADDDEAGEGEADEGVAPARYISDAVDDDRQPDRSDEVVDVDALAPDRSCDIIDVGPCDSPDRSPPRKNDKGKTLPASLPTLEASSCGSNGADTSLAGKVRPCPSFSSPPADADYIYPEQLAPLSTSVQHLHLTARYPSAPIEVATTSRKRGRASVSSIETALPSHRSSGDVLSPVQPPRKKPALASSSALSASRDNSYDPRHPVPASHPQSLGDLLVNREVVRLTQQDAWSGILPLERNIILLQYAMQALHGLAPYNASLASDSTYASITSPNRHHPHPVSTNSAHSVNDTTIAAPNGDAPAPRRMTRRSTNAVAGPSKVVR